MGLYVRNRQCIEEACLDLASGSISGLESVMRGSDSAPHHSLILGLEHWTVAFCIVCLSISLDLWGAVIVSGVGDELDDLGEGDY